MKFFQLIPAVTNIDFIGKFKIFVVFSIFTVVVTLVGMFTKGFNFGIDFTGGTVVQVKFIEPQKVEDVRNIVTAAGEPDASVVAFGKEGLEYIITSRTTSDAKSPETLTMKLQNHLGGRKMSVEKGDIVGPKVGKELKKAAVLSLVYSVLLIMVYIWFRFDLKFAPGATIAMIHDIILASGFYLVTGEEFTITSVAALLTIAGYSVNDTIVIYDRVRELLKVGGQNLPLGETINKAINLTLSRTLLTSGVTLLSLVPIVFVCKGEIQAFAKCMLVGLFVGSYSTIYIAAPFTIYAQKFLKQDKGGLPRPGFA